MIESERRRGDPGVPFSNTYKDEDVGEEEEVLGAGVEEPHAAPPSLP